MDCECGCGRQTDRDFAPGHDLTAKNMLIDLEYKGSTVEFLRRHGYGRGGRNLKEEWTAKT